MSKLRLNPLPIVLYKSKTVIKLCGIYLCLPQATIKEIEMDNTTVKGKIRDMISEWLYSGKATWENLVLALVKTGVLSSEDLPQPQLHGMLPLQPSHTRMPEINIWKNVWEIQIKDLHKMQRAYVSQRVLIHKKMKTSILHIRFILGVPNDVSDEILMGTIERYMTIKLVFVSWVDLVLNITNIVEISHYNIELLEKLTDLLQNSSTEVCKLFETVLKLKANQKNFLHKNEVEMLGTISQYSDSPENEIKENQQTDCIE